MCKDQAAARSHLDHPPTGVVGVGVFDIVENLISFPMLARSTTFWSGPAIAQSTAAVTEFALICSGLAALFVAIIVLAAARLTKERPRTLAGSADATPPQLGTTAAPTGRPS